MPIDSGTILSAAALVIGCVVWLVRLEGRINVTATQFTEIINRLARIERRQDDAQ